VPFHVSEVSLSKVLALIIIPDIGSVLPWSASYRLLWILIEKLNPPNLYSLLHPTKKEKGKNLG